MLKKVLPKIYNNQLFHSNLKRNNYFENWLFKLVSEDRKSVFTIIPVLVLGKNKLCYIEILNGLTGETFFKEFPLNKYSVKTDTMYCKIDNTVFSKDGISLDLKLPENNLKGEINFGDLNPFKGSSFSPGIIGFFSFIPFLESYISIVSMHTQINGNITIGSNSYNFANGSCYIEKNWGKKYPEFWLWTQCNTFNVKNSSVFLSISPGNLYGRKFVALLCYFVFEGKVYNFSLHKRARVTSLKKEGRTVFIEIQKKQLKLDISIIPRIAGKIKVPSASNNDRFINESSTATIHLNLYNTDKQICSIEGEFADFNLVGDIIGFVNRETD